MGLADQVTDRLGSSPRLKQLTNPGVQNPAGVNTTVLGKAATDVEADFKIYAGVEYNDSVDTHVAAGINAVLAKLAQWAEGAGSTADSLREKYIEDLQALGKITGRNRPMPKSTSVLTTSSERKDVSETVRPDSDREHFDDLVPEAPS